MFWIIFLSVILIDQFTKLLASFYPSLFTVTINSGMAFSIFESWSAGTLTVILIVIAIFLYRLLASQWQRNPILSALFWGGALSNMIDRFLQAGVTDWLALPLFQIRNNVADIAMTISLVALLIKEIKYLYESR